MALTQQEINERMTELRNLRTLYGAQKIQNEKLRKENKALKARVRELEERDREKDARIADLMLQVEELRTMVFGKQKQRQKDSDEDDPPLEVSRTPRTTESYQRPVPKEEDITHTVHHPLTHRHSITRTRTKTYYEEDIPIPKKTVTKHIVTQGYCTTCKLWVTDIPLPPCTVRLGERTKRYITYLHTVARLSYSQIRELLSITYTLSVSDGEITSILEREARSERPHYEQLKERIRGEPSVHMDETGWYLQHGDGIRRYGWTLVGGETGDRVYTLGKTRGKGNATELLGDTEAVVVSDDYAVYRNLTQPHQLCCAHIHRKLRDLKGSAMLSESIRTHCQRAYAVFAGIYADIEQKKDYRHLLKRLQQFVTPHHNDPLKLKRKRPKWQHNSPTTLPVFCIRT